MGLLLRNARIVDPSQGMDQVGDLLVEGGKISCVGERISPEGHDVQDCTGWVAVPGLVDMHVHLRDPGLTYKEDIFTGTAAANHYNVRVALMPVKVLLRVPHSYCPG